MFAKRILSSRWIRPAVLASTVPVYWYSTQTAPLFLDSSIFNEKEVLVDSSVPAFPTSIDLSAPYELLGYGARSVTFLKFKVYALGIYINSQDVPLARKLLSQQTDVESALRDPEASTPLVDSLLSAGVRFTAKITPVRNTDFNHLRDGLVKSAMAHPLAKGKDKAESVARGLDELRAIFNAKKGSAPKGTNLFLETLANGELRVSFQGQEMGVVTEPIVSRLLFLQYLSGKNPLSEPTRQSSASGLSLLCK